MGGFELDKMPNTWEEETRRIGEAIRYKSWQNIEKELSEYGNEIFARRLTELGYTPLLLAAMYRYSETSLIQNLVKKTPPELLALTDYRGNTALHFLQFQSDHQTLDMLLAKCPYLRFFRNVDGAVPNVDNIRDDTQPGEPEWWGHVKEAVEKGNWRLIEKAICEQTAIKTFAIMKFGEKIQTPLHYAIERGRDPSLLNKMIDWMPAELLSQTDSEGKTVLQLLTDRDRRYGETVEKLVLKNPDLLNFENNNKFTAIQAVIEEEPNYPIAKSLFSAAKKLVEPFKDNSRGESIYKSLITAQYYDLAWELLGLNPSIAVFYPCLLTLLESLLCPEAHSSQYGPPGRAKISPERLLDSKQVKLLVRRICVIIRFSKESDPNLFKEPFFYAVQTGIVYIVEEILKAHPPAIEFKDVNNHSAFQLAVMYRSQVVFNALYKAVHVKDFQRLLCLKEKSTGNNILHLAGEKARQGGRLFDLEHRGPILQVQNEVRWFKEVQKFLPREERMKLNNDRKFPIELFVEKHRDLIDKEMNWVTSMAEACSTAAALIATVAFASTIQIPGGNSDKGGPNYDDKASFSLFGASNALALLFSVTAVLTFLSIFTSRFDAEDFLSDLPSRLILGLIALIISVISLMIAFACALFLVFGQKSMFLGPLTMFAAIPVILYATLQMPPLCNIIRSTVWGFRLGPQPERKPFKLCLQEGFWAFIGRFKRITTFRGVS